MSERGSLDYREDFLGYLLQFLGVEIFPTACFFTEMLDTELFLEALVDEAENEHSSQPFASPAFDVLFTICH
jgi:hypothetical protein